MASAEQIFRRFSKISVAKFLVKVVSGMRSFGPAALGDPSVVRGDGKRREVGVDPRWACLRARAGEKQIRRPRRVSDRQQLVTLRDQEKLSWPEIALKLGVGVGTVRRAYDAIARRQTPDKPVELPTVALQPQSGELPGTVEL